MLKHRVIPILLWDGASLVVQTVDFKRPARVFGSLMDAVRVYDRRNVDELILIDIEATRQNRRPNFEAVGQFTEQVFCPVTVGGGIRTLGDIRDLLKCGADKVAIKKAATPEFISKAAAKFGAQCITMAIDYDSNWHLDTAKRVARSAEESGAGELLLTSVPRNGTLKGYDLDLIRRVAAATTIPVVAHGGCGEPRHMLEAIEAGADAVAASSMFLFYETTPRECSEYLAEHGIAARVA